MAARTLKQSIRNGIVELFSVLGVAALYRQKIRREGPLVRIVVFHDVPDVAWFESMIEALVDSCHVISPAEFHTEIFDPVRVNVLVTFDDGYQSWITVALPILQKHNVKALFFVSSGLIDVADDQAKVYTFMRDQLLISSRPALGWEGVRHLREAGHTIGGHARTHANLTKLAHEALVAEIQTDKHTLESKLGTTLTDFAYPFGTKAHVNDAVVDAVRDAGYVRAYTAISRFATNPETFYIPRMCIETGLSRRSLKRWINGAYDLFDMVKMLGRNAQGS